MLILYPKLHEQSIREMLRKARQQQQHNRKAKQHNTTRPKQSFFKEKLAASGDWWFLNKGPCPVYCSGHGRQYVGNDVVDESH